MENLDDKEKAKHAPIAVADTSDKNDPKTPKQTIQTSDESDQETPIFSIKKPSPQRKVQKVQIVRSDGGKLKFEVFYLVRNWSKCQMESYNYFLHPKIRNNSNSNNSLNNSPFQLLVTFKLKTMLVKSKWYW